MTEAIIILFLYLIPGIKYIKIEDQPIYQFQDLVYLNHKN